MLIHFSDNKTNFNARNKTIRFADDIARKVNQNYPRISSSNIEDFKVLDNGFLSLFERLVAKTLRLRSRNWQDFWGKQTWDNAIKIVPENVKKFKMGNCAESAVLSEIAARTNGIQDCFQVSIFSRDYKDFDHRVLYVNDKKPYIIDAWLGFADYLPKAIERYTKEYRHHFDFKDLNTEKMIFVPTPLDQRLVKPDFYEYPTSEYQAVFPELIIKQGSK